MPLVVLSAGQFTLPGAPAEVTAEIPALMADKARKHRALAQLSSRGVYAPIPDSGHMMMQDKPKAVIDAIGQVVDQARARPRPGKPSLERAKPSRDPEHRPPRPPRPSPPTR